MDGASTAGQSARLIIFCNATNQCMYGVVTPVSFAFVPVCSSITPNHLFLASVKPKLPICCNGVFHARTFSPSCGAVGKWYLSPVGADCNSVCRDNNLVCTNEVRAPILLQSCYKTKLSMLTDFPYLFIYLFDQSCFVSLLRRSNS